MLPQSSVDTPPRIAYAAHKRDACAAQGAPPDIARSARMLERELFLVLEGTADAAYAIDEQGLVRSCNPASEELFGPAPSDVPAKPCAEGSTRRASP